MGTHRMFKLFAIPLMAVAALVFGVAGPAAADAPTDRLTLTSHAYGEIVVLHVFTLDGHDHAWGQVGQGGDWFTGVCVWEQQTNDPTLRTVWGPEDRNCVVSPYGTTSLSTLGSYTTPLYDGPGYYVRACADYRMPDGTHAVMCTDWN